MDPAPRSSLIWVHNVCLYAKIGLKRLQEYSADETNRRHFQMQIFLALCGLKQSLSEWKQFDFSGSKRFPFRVDHFSEGMSNRKSRKLPPL